MAQNRDIIRQRLDLSLAQVLGRQGQIVGAAFLIDADTLLTCAHVVNLALGLSDDSTEVPGRPVPLVFLFSNSLSPVLADVVEWRTMEERGTGDIAVLRLLERPPTDTAPAFIVQPDTVWKHNFWVCGVPDGYPMGRGATGHMLHRLANGWVQLEDVKTEGPPVDRGFSGTCVWDEQVQGIVGMVARIDPDLRNKTSYMIPVDVLARVWPPLESYIEEVPLRTDTLALTLKHISHGPITFAPVTAISLLKHVSASNSQHLVMRVTRPNRTPSQMFVDSVELWATTCWRYMGYAIAITMDHLLKNERSVEIATFDDELHNDANQTIAGIRLDLQLPRGVNLGRLDTLPSQIDQRPKREYKTVVMEIPELRPGYMCSLPKFSMLCSHQLGNGMVWGEWIATSSSVIGLAGGLVEMNLSGRRAKLAGFLVLLSAPLLLLPVLSWVLLSSIKLAALGFGILLVLFVVLLISSRLVSHDLS